MHWCEIPWHPKYQCPRPCTATGAESLRSFPKTMNHKCLEGLVTTRDVHLMPLTKHAACAPRFASHCISLANIFYRRIVNVSVPKCIIRIQRATRRIPVLRAVMVAWSKSTSSTRHSHEALAIFVSPSHTVLAQLTVASPRGPVSTAT